jgi:cation diffusion facilitator family transporter
MQVNTETRTITGGCSCAHSQSNIHESRTKIVVLISAITMLVELFFGYTSNSMALLSDGWHMASHVLAMGLTWFTYVYCRKNKTNQKFKNGTDKILSLSGYTSGLLLLAIALWMAFECVIRLFVKENVQYNNALLVTVIGLIVNFICAYILSHNNKNHDHNIKAAYLHVLADVLTSVLAIVALVIGKIYNQSWLDAISGIIGAVLITKWAYGLIKQSGAKLLDYEHE